MPCVEEIRLGKEIARKEEDTTGWKYNVRICYEQFFHWMNAFIQWLLELIHCIINLIS